MSDGFQLGVVMLNTAFPRLRGDIGNPKSFSFAVDYRRVASASVSAVTGAGAPPASLLADIEAAALELEEAGADLVVTSCGFLGSLQERLSSALRVPVLTSSLVLLPLIRALHGRERPVGVLTFDSSRLSREHFPTPTEGPLEVVGLEEGEELHRVIDGDLPSLDRMKAEADALAALDRLLARAPATAAVLLECTNISPYRRALAARCGLPVYDLNSAIDWIAGQKGSYSAGGRG